MAESCIWGLIVTARVRVRVVTCILLLLLRTEVLYLRSL